jgi:DNA-binding XRE family transcriptional regulator
MVDTMHKKEFSQIRTILGKTQNQMARILCVSPKAIQSFEQGWRKIPTNTEREMLLLLYLKSSGRSSRTCWEITRCPEEWRNNCIVWDLQRGDFCWYFSGTNCKGQIIKSWNEKFELCKNCEVHQLMFSASHIGSTNGPKSDLA